IAASQTIHAFHGHSPFLEVWLCRRAQSIPDWAYSKTKTSKRFIIPCSASGFFVSSRLAPWKNRTDGREVMLYEGSDERHCGQALARPLPSLGSSRHYARISQCDGDVPRIGASQCPCARLALLRPDSDFRRAGRALDGSGFGSAATRPEAG